jgi:hypothetical protein
MASEPAKGDEEQQRPKKAVKEKGPKIGEGHLAAMGRLGLTELRNAFNPSRESVADSEVGLYGTATQGEIAQARDHGEETSLGQIKADADRKAQEQQKESPSKSQGMER